MNKIVVIGANHAGTAAINTILDNYGNTSDVTVFDQNSNISFLGCGMALWIGQQIGGSEGLFYSSREKLEAKGAHIHMETTVENIDYAKKIVYAREKNGKTYEQPYDKLILSTGSLPIQPKIPGMDLKNVQYVKLFQDAQAVIDKLKDSSIKHVTVVGAGYIGVELAEAFKRNGRETTLVDCVDTCLASYYDPMFCNTMAKHLESHGVQLAFGQTVQSVEGNGKVERIVTDKGTIETDMVVFGIGFKPNTSLGQGALVKFKNGAYLVDRCQQTNNPSVYAIGDCATVYNNSIQGTDYIALATNAVRSGIIAAHNVCGTRLQSPGVQGSNGISIWGLNMLSTGLSLTRAKWLGYDAECSDFEDLQKPEFMEHGNFKVKIRIVYDKLTRIVLGAQLCSDQDISMAIHMFSLAIQEQITIDKLKLLDIFFLPHFNKPYNYITMAAISAK